MRNQEKKMDELYKKSAEYVFRTFPSEKNGEWVQIRSRDGCQRKGSSASGKESVSYYEELY